MSFGTTMRTLSIVLALIALFCGLTAAGIGHRALGYKKPAVHTLLTKPGFARAFVV